MQTIADRLKYARERREWTQTRLAVIAGVSTGTIGNIESGARQSKGSLPQIAEALGVNHKWLATGQGTPDTTPTLPAVYQPNAPIPLAGRAGGAITLESAIDALRGHIRASGANKAAVAALLSAVANDPDDERAAQALHLMLDTAFAQTEKSKAQA